MSIDKILTLQFGGGLVFSVDLNEFSVYKGAQLLGPDPKANPDLSTALMISPNKNITKQYEKHQPEQDEKDRLIEYKKRPEVDPVEYSIQLSGFRPYTLQVLLSIVKRFKDSPQLTELTVDAQEITEVIGMSLNELTHDIIRDAKKANNGGKKQNG